MRQDRCRSFAGGSIAQTAGPMPPSCSPHPGAQRRQRHVLRVRLTRFHLLVGGTVLLALVIGFGSTGAWRWWLWTLLGSGSGLCLGLGVSFPAWQMFGQSLCRVPCREKRVALTFDDGPDLETTPQLLTLLAQKQIRATFFCVGKRVAQASDLARRIVAEGHAIENHSYAHNPWTNLFSETQLRADLALAQRQIQSVTGRVPRFFRPPMGLTNQRVFRIAHDLQLQVAGYSARGLDRGKQPPEQVVARLLRGLRPGDVLLLHDAGVPLSQLLGVVTLLIERLEAQDFRCVRLDELADGAKP